MDPETMCAIVNDNQRMEEKCNEFGTYLLQFLTNAEEKELLRGVLVSLLGSIYLPLPLCFSLSLSLSLSL
jgi:hypothetical protein